MAQSAKATYTEGSKRQKIDIVIDGMPLVLAIGECIEFKRDVKAGADPLTIGKIMGFGYAGGAFVNRLFYLPWRVDTKKWGSTQNTIGLEPPFSGGVEGDWTTIVKLAACPDAVIGGRRHSRRGKRRTVRRRGVSRRRRA